MRDAACNPNNMHIVRIATLCCIIGETRNRTCFEGKLISSPIELICHMCAFCDIGKISHLRRLSGTWWKKRNDYRARRFRCMRWPYHLHLGQWMARVEMKTTMRCLGGWGVARKLLVWNHLVCSGFVLLCSLWWIRSRFMTRRQVRILVPRRDKLSALGSCNGGPDGNYYDIMHTCGNFLFRRT
jgi:hypothetical protein